MTTRTEKFIQSYKILLANCEMCIPKGEVIPPWLRDCRKDLEGITALDLDINQDKYVIDRHKFIQHFDAVLEYHSDDKEFCDNYRKDFHALTRDSLFGETKNDL